MVAPPLGGSSDHRDGGSTGDEEEEEVPMGEEEVDVIGTERKKADDHWRARLAAAVKAKEDGKEESYAFDW